MEPPKHNGLLVAVDKFKPLLTVTLRVVVLAHCPAAGVNVYVPDVVLLIRLGDHVPLIPLLEVSGRVGAAEPLHIGPIGLKVGVTGGSTVTGTVTVVEHPQELVTVKVYVVELEGQAVGFRMFVADRPVAGDQLYVKVF